MSSTIIQLGAEVLREKAVPLTEADIKSPRLKDVLAKLKKVLAEREDGVAIAAPQIGVTWRLFMVSTRAFDEMGKPGRPELIFINPEIIRRSRSKREMIEGCLSVNNVYGRTRRHEKVTIKALDERGQQVTYNATGLLAQIFQHEVDHLNGVLFVDHARDLEIIEPEAAKPKKDA